MKIDTPCENIFSLIFSYTKLSGKLVATEIIFLARAIYRVPVDAIVRYSSAEAEILAQFDFHNLALVFLPYFNNLRDVFFLAATVGR